MLSNIFSMPVFFLFLFPRLKISEKDADKLVLVGAEQDQQIHIMAKPFQIHLISKDEILLSMNSNGLLYLEHLQSPPQSRYDITLIYKRKGGK